MKLIDEKVYTLAYADDLMLLEEGGMRSMMARPEGYMREKSLTVSVEKSKILKFGKGEGEGK